MELFEFMPEDWPLKKHPHRDGFVTRPADFLSHWETGQGEYMVEDEGEYHAFSLSKKEYVIFLQGMIKYLQAILESL